MIFSSAFLMPSIIASNFERRTGLLNVASHRLLAISADFSAKRLVGPERKQHAIASTRQARAKRRASKTRDRRASWLMAIDVIGAIDMRTCRSKIRRLSMRHQSSSCSPIRRHSQFLDAHFGTGAPRPQFLMMMPHGPPRYMIFAGLSLGRSLADMMANDVATVERYEAGDALTFPPRLSFLTAADYYYDTSPARLYRRHHRHLA